MQIAPKEEQELQALRKYKGPRGALKPPEQLLHMLAGVPRVVQKMEVLVVRQNYKVCPTHARSAFICSRVLGVSASVGACMHRPNLQC